MTNFIESTINYIASKEWGIDADWGISQFAQFLMSAQTSDTNVVLKELKEQSLTVNFFAGGLPTQIEYSGDNKIAEIAYSGVMHLHDGLCHYGANKVVAELYKAYSDPTIKGILFTIDSGGGEPQAGSEISAAIKDRNKPVVSRFTLAGSAAYMAIAPSNEIIAANMYAKVGSIGAYVSLNKAFLTRYAEAILDVYADSSPNKNIELREALQGNFVPIKKSVEELAVLFQKDVMKSRPISPDFTDTLTGGVFKAQEGKRRGLIDAIGTKQYALKRVISYTK